MEVNCIVNGLVFKVNYFTTKNINDQEIIIIESINFKDIDMESVLSESTIIEIIDQVERNYLMNYPNVNLKRAF